MHTFCSNDGTAVGDELTLAEYLDLDVCSWPHLHGCLVLILPKDLPVTDEPGIAFISITFRKAGSAKVSSKWHGASEEVKAMMEQLKPDLTFRVALPLKLRVPANTGLQDRSQDELKMDTSSFKVEEQLDASQFAAHEVNPAKFVIHIVHISKLMKRY